MTEQKNSADIVIVGAGIIGATLALCLSGCGLRVLVVDAGKRKAYLKEAGSENARMIDQIDLRVSALTAASQHLYSGLGVWPDMVAERVSPFTHMTVWDAEGTGRIEFDAREVHQAALGHIVENSIVVDVLHRRLDECELVDLQFGRTVQALSSDGDTQCLTVHREGPNGELVHDNLRCSLVVGADGANSQIRKLAGIPTREWDYQHNAVVATVKTEKDHGNAARQRFIETGPLAFLPLQVTEDAQHYCSIVWSMVPGKATDIMALSDEAFCKALAEDFEHELGAVTDVSRRVSFPLRQRHAKFYVKPGLALVGDAAHTIHPLAGQGANIGLLDVAVLSDELLRAVDLGLSPGNELVLKRYQRRRIGPNLAMMGVMEGFKRLFAEDDIGIRWVRNTGMKWLNSVPFVKNEIISQAMGLNVPMPRVGGV